MATTNVAAINSAVVTQVKTNLLGNLRADLIHAQFAAEGSIDKGHKTITFLEVPDLAESATTLADDGTNPTAEALSLNTFELTPSEIGRLVSITRRAQNVSPFALIKAATDVLSYDARRRIDTIAADALKAGGTARYSGSATSRATVTANTIAADVRKWGTKMRALNAMPWGDSFVALTDPFVVGDLMAETGATSGSWNDVSKYAAPDRIFNGEAGRLYKSRFIETTQSPVFAAAGSGGVDVYVAIILGKGAFGMGSIQGLTPTYVPATPDHADGLGRTALVGYYLDMGAKTFNTSRFIRFETAATAL